MKFLIMFLVLIFFIGCATTVTQQGAKVKIGKADPPKSCEELGDVTASSFYFCMEQCQRNRLRNNAAEIGANYLRLDSTSPTGSAGIAFKCPKDKKK